MFKQTLACLALAVVVALPSVSKAGVVLPPAPSLTFGDFTVHSMALLQFAEDGTTNMSAGDTFYIPTSPGQIHDDIVVMTKNPGGTAADNGDISPFIDDAFGAHSGTDLERYTFAGRETDPDFQPQGDRSASTTGGTDSWEANVGAISTFLDGDDLVFWFNLNENGTASQLDGQDLLAWAEVKLYDAVGVDTGHVFFLNGNGSPSGPIDKYGRSDWGYVHSEITVDPATGLFVHPGPPTQADKANGFVALDQNLGAKKAAFSISNQELSDLVNDANNSGWTLSVKIELGDINNGYEQVIIRGPSTARPVPEPTSVAIWGLMVGVVGLTGSRRRRRRA